jgi:6-pyruvoyltetrahydropterin/6-carboxytetrahydropterin synthase
MLIHGYSFYFKVWFASNEILEENQLDDMGWVVDFGGFKSQPKGNGLKDWLNEMFDHTLLLQEDDPYIDIFENLEQFKVCKLIKLKKIGAESLAKYVFDKFNDVLSKTDAGRCRVVKVECFENDKNSGIYIDDKFLRLI